MKTILFFLCLLTCTHTPAEEKSYTASTPANNTVRHFLGINQKDSIDFIRWQLTIKDKRQFSVACAYGIGKPSTNGFIDEKKVTLKGDVTIIDNILTLTRDSKSLSLLVLNENIMHLLNPDQTMMKGNGGWSYTINSLKPVSTTEIRVKPYLLGFEDSIVFEGRTPCRGVEDILEGKSRPECYKLKWLVRLYKDKTKPTSGTYRIGRNGKSGTWKTKETRSGNIIYSLDMKNGRSLDLLHTDKNIVYIMNGRGGIFVGDHDFSYSLNRRG